MKKYVIQIGESYYMGKIESKTGVLEIGKPSVLIRNPVCGEIQHAKRYNYIIAHIVKWFMPETSLTTLYTPEIILIN